MLFLDGCAKSRLDVVEGRGCWVEGPALIVDWLLEGLLLLDEELVDEVLLTEMVL